MRASILLLVAAIATACSPAGSGSAAHTPSGLAPSGKTWSADGGPPVELVELPSSEERPSVPGFEDASTWLNTTTPLSLSDLRGRVVIVDFWTSGCINCLHTLPVLRELEERFEDQGLVVVGVHSPKFDKEKDATKLADSIAALGIAHPVALDESKLVWKAWEARTWPTLVVLDAQGRAVWRHRGEPSKDELERVVASAIAEADASGQLQTERLASVRPQALTTTGLRFPSKLLPLDGGRLAIADTGNHRILIVDGDTTKVIGDGTAGLKDGAATSARFRRPHGMALWGDALYVADTDNHTIRRIDLESLTVSTVAGTGELSTQRLIDAPAPAAATALRSPWDLLALGDKLVVAMAGSHQIGVFDPRAGTIARLAGSSKERLTDGPYEEAAFAQPSALATDGERIFVLDTESSAIRVLDPKERRVSTLVGKGLFDFGDVDGDADRVRLQHPEDLLFHDGALLVADSYNSKIKRVDPVTGSTETLSLPGLSEPRGLAVSDTGLLIADTNHHRLVAHRAGEPLQTLALTIERPATKKKVIDPSDPVEDFGPLLVPPTESVSVHVPFVIPVGTKLNKGSPVRVTWVEGEGLARLPEAQKSESSAVADGFTFELHPAPDESQGTLAGVLELVLCDEEGARVCLPVRRTLVAEWIAEPGATPRANAVKLPPAE